MPASVLKNVLRTGGRPYTPCQDTFKPSLGTHDDIPGALLRLRRNLSPSIACANNAFPTRYCPDMGYRVSRLASGAFAGVAGSHEK